METTKQSLSLSKKRYATYLKPETIKAVRRFAYEHEVPDYVVAQKAIDEFLQKRAPIRLPIG